MHGAAQSSRTCRACGGELFRFEPPASIRGVERSALPTACQRCGQICVDGTPLAFPPAFQEKVAGIAEESARQARLARQQLLSDPAVRVEKYFDHVYRTGFVHGFVRALAWFTHQAKEGRLRRLRRIWRAADRSPSTAEVEIRMSPEAYSEFERLIELDVFARGDDAQGASNAGQAG
jgi:hypothetical protein